MVYRVSWAKTNGETSRIAAAMVAYRVGFSGVAGPPATPRETLTSPATPRETLRSPTATKGPRLPKQTGASTLG